MTDWEISKSIPAHPRVSGENVWPYPTSEKLSGSSPRERGKLAIPPTTEQLARLIPA